MPVSANPTRRRLLAVGVNMALGILAFLALPKRSAQAQSDDSEFDETESDSAEFDDPQVDEAPVEEVPVETAPVADAPVDNAGPAYVTYMCVVSGFIYDEAKGLPDEGIAAGTRWKDIPDTWICPDCGVSKSDFELTVA